MNRLVKEKSPYLQQHKNNPVDWYPWGREAFQIARDQNKLIFLSIGYSTCYWCHVMEKDCFEKESVAKVLNQDFISIKVDREEHPDVDEIYMDAIVGMTGRGGWPMTVFLTPDLRPFWGGTYFPEEQFLQILSRLQDFWQQRPEEITEAAKKITEHLTEREVKGSLTTEIFSNKLFENAFQQLELRFDATYGGFGMAPKFPPSMSIYLLHRIYKNSKNEKALQFSTTTLNAMACGGLYDHLGGGFHRYSTDDYWLVPHFEKMLYDNALLSVAYLEAYQITNEKMYADIAKNTLDYVIREMQAPLGGYYSAQDAGEVHKEGEFYVWTEKEITSLLSSEELHSFSSLYPISAAGNFENSTNIFHLREAADWEKRNHPLIKSSLEKLLQTRCLRAAPHKDTKILSSWNGLMLSAMAKGYQILGDEKYLKSAIDCANFLQKNLWKNNRLLRRYADGEARFLGTLSDYAYCIHGLIDLYESSFDVQWISWAIELQKIQDELFWDNNDAGYFTGSHEEENLIVRKKDTTDNAIPSGNSVSAMNLLRLYHFTFDEQFENRAKNLLNFLKPELEKIPSGVCFAFCALDWTVNSVKEIAIIGASADENTSAMQYLYKQFLPRKVLAYTVTEKKAASALKLLEGKIADAGRSTFYVCENKTCAPPVYSLEHLESLL